MIHIPRTTIAFAGGAYGNYFLWVLYTLLSDSPIQLPFLKSTSHGKSYIDPQLIENGTIKFGNIGLDDISDNAVKLSTIHPIGARDRSATDFNVEIEKISEIVDKVLIPYFDHSTYLLGVNNWVNKVGVWEDDQDRKWEQNGSLNGLDLDNIRKGWNIEFDNPSDVPKYILREYFSFCLFDSWESANGWFSPGTFKKENCKFIFISNFFYKFLDTLEEIQQFLDVEWKKDPTELLPYHNTNISRQEYLGQDVLAKNILDSLITQQYFSWKAEDITLYTEAYIQMMLRKQNIQLKCHNLNDFPTSTKELFELIE